MMQKQQQTKTVHEMATARKLPSEGVTPGVWHSLHGFSFYTGRQITLKFFFPELSSSPSTGFAQCQKNLPAAAVVQPAAVS